MRILNLLICKLINIFDLIKVYIHRKDKNRLLNFLFPGDIIEILEVSDNLQRFFGAERVRFIVTKIYFSKGRFDISLNTSYRKSLLMVHSDLTITVNDKNLIEMTMSTHIVGYNLNKVISETINGFNIIKRSLFFDKSYYCDSCPLYLSKICNRNDISCVYYKNDTDGDFSERVVIGDIIEYGDIESGTFRIGRVTGLSMVGNFSLLILVNGITIRRSDIVRIVKKNGILIFNDPCKLCILSNCDSCKLKLLKNGLNIIYRNGCSIEFLISGRCY